MCPCHMPRAEPVPLTFISTTASRRQALSPVLRRGPHGSKSISCCLSWKAFRRSRTQTRPGPSLRGPAPTRLLPQEGSRPLPDACANCDTSSAGEVRSVLVSTSGIMFIVCETRSRLFIGSPKMRQRPPPRRDMTIVSGPLQLGSQPLAKDWPPTLTSPFPRMHSSTRQPCDANPIDRRRNAGPGDHTVCLWLCDS